MDIYWYGGSCFHLKGKESSVLTDPATATTAKVLGKAAPDVVTLSKRGELKPEVPNGRVLTGPGEYEVKGVMATGYPSFYAGERVGAFYKITVDDIVICHLGCLREPLNASQVEDLSDVDVLLVPVAGDDRSIDGSTAIDMMNLIEPRIVLPMSFELGPLGVSGTPAEHFLHELGRTDVITPQPKVSVTRTSLPLEATVVVLDVR